MKFLSYHAQQPFEPVEKGNWDFKKPLSRGHDCNITYYDGETLHYIKTERLFQIKHHRIYEDECDDITKKLWGITRNEVDDFIFTSFYGNTVGESNEEYDVINHIYAKSKSNGFQYIDHHYAHALCVSLLNDIDVSINIDGSGAFKSWSVYRDSKVIDCGYHETVGSIGGGYSRLAKPFHIKGHSDDAAGKLMGLQSYGKINEEYLQYLKKYNFNNNVHPIFDLQNYINYLADTNEAKKTKIDWLRTVHERAGEIVFDLFEKYASKNERIGYSGGVAQNVLWNTQLKEKYPNLVIMPYSSDEGLSLGGMEYLRRKHNLSKFNIENFPFAQSDESPETVCTQLDRVANALANGKIVAWYQGNGEIGPRALGNRSILMDPRIPNGKDKMNEVKNREFFRPFGASILTEYAKEYFDIDFENPYMLYVGKSQKDNLQSITHIDGTCRVQTVSTGLFRNLLEKFYELTGCPVLMNTSLNVSGKPIAGYIKDIKLEFLNNKKIDMLVIGDEIYER